MSHTDASAERGEEIRASIALVLDGPRAPIWQVQILAALDASQSLVVERLLLTAGPHDDGLTRRLRAALERHVFSIANDPMRRVDVTPRERALAPDLTLWLAEGQAPPADVGELARVRHGDRFEPAETAFWRALRSGHDCLRSELVLVSGGTARVLASTVSELRPYSEALSRTLALWKLAAWVPRSLERGVVSGGLGSGGATSGGHALVDASAGRPHVAERPAQRAASDLGLLRQSALRAARAMLTRACFRRPWSIVVAESRRDGASASVPADAGLVRWGRARTYADPFLFEHEGRHHLFCEEVPEGETYGVISHTELSPNGATLAAPPKPVLRAAHHLSYPFLFAHQGQVFMIPETSAVRRVELYRARAFPHDWEREAVLLDDLDVADATLLTHDGLMWLFASVAAPGASSLDELHLFWARKLHGPWRPHPLNPVVSDARCARPAGAIQRWGARLIRPAQDCSRRYGWSISLREIDLLSTSEYAEHEIDRVEPSALPDARAIHTYSSDSRFQAWDVRRRQARWGRQRGVPHAGSSVRANRPPPA